MLSTANITIQFGPKPLFENVSAKFSGGRYGLIGANGAGKSTFMKILAGRLEATSGSVITGDGERIGVLGQDQFAFEEYTAVEAVMIGYAELWEVHQERNRIYSLPEMSEEEGILVAELEVQYAELDGYTAESRAETLLAGLGISQEMQHRPMSEIAPGLKLRVLLAQVLFADPDIMLLDEPTNNLDIDTIRWLESELVQRKATMIIISHDRHFLNQVCTHIADLDYGELRLYPGNYDEYMTAATIARERLAAAKQRQDTKIKELQTFVSRFSANASKAKQATSRARQIDKMEQIEIKPSSRRSPFIRFEQEKKLHRLAVETTKISNGYENELLFKDLTFAVEAGERLAIIGPNGIGKTTMLRTLVNDLELKDGAIKWAENAKPGYFPQHHVADFDYDIKLMDWMDQWSRPEDDEQVIRGVLGRLLFSKTDVDKKVKVLSGGEQARMLFGKLMLQRPNVLVLDEPTNHLDMESIEALNLALEHFPGTIIFVSHDRQLVSSLATHIIAMSEEGVEEFRGTYEEYLMSKGVAE